MTTFMNSVRLSRSSFEELRNQRIDYIYSTFTKSYNNKNIAQSAKLNALHPQEDWRYNVMNFSVVRLYNKFRNI